MAIPKPTKSKIQDGGKIPAPGRGGGDPASTGPATRSFPGLDKSKAYGEMKKAAGPSMKGRGAK